MRGPATDDATPATGSLAGLVSIVVAVLAGVLVGLFVTIHSLDPNRAGQVVGAWRTEPGDGDPYARATTARAGLLPLGAGEGLSFIARTDSAGAPLAKTCDYSVKGPMPPARYWSLSLLTPDGFPVANPAVRYAITSAEALRFNQAPVLITVSAEARAGNWLPTGHAPHYVLMLRLYDTGLSTVGTTLADTPMPSITRETCR